MMMIGGLHTILFFKILFTFYKLSLSFCSKKVRMSHFAQCLLRYKNIFYNRHTKFPKKLEALIIEYLEYSVFQSNGNCIFGQRLNYWGASATRTISLRDYLHSSLARESEDVAAFCFLTYLLVSFANFFQVIPENKLFRITFSLSSSFLLYLTYRFIEHGIYTKIRPSLYNEDAQMIRPEHLIDHYERK